MTEPDAAPTGPPAASLPEYLSLPLTAVMAESSAAWLHHCGTLNVRAYEPGAICSGCFRDVDPADVKTYRLTTMTNTVLATPGKQDREQRERLRRVAALAPRVLPGPVGETIARELLTWAEFGYRFGNAGIINRLLDDIEKREKPSK